MKRLFILISIFAIIPFALKAQESERLHGMGKNYLVDGDYANAEMMLSNAYALDSENISIIKDLTLCNYFQKELKKGLAIIKKTIDNGTADDQCYQIAGNFYKAMHEISQCDTLYRKALLKFPDNGAIHNELGEVLFSLNNRECIDYWEKGIKKDPAYPKNYFNASKFYSVENNHVWAILYGEIFVNLDPFGPKTAEVKDIILSAYRNYYHSENSESGNKDKNKFFQKIINNFDKQASIGSQNMTLSNLVMIRTRFILDWYYDKTDRYPFRLFEWQQQLLRQGLFEAYNQWLFGPSVNLTTFQNWTQLHNTEYAAFNKMLKSDPFKTTTGQYYR